MASLTFYGGVNEIGGNKILLEDKGTRILLDFGQSFSLGSDYFAGWLQPRAVNGLGDYFEFSLLPKIRGVYAREQLDIPPYAMTRLLAKLESNHYVTRKQSGNDKIVSLRDTSRTNEKKSMVEKPTNNVPTPEPADT